LRAVFFGTPPFAVPSLEALLQHHAVPLVVTQPDRPSGRGLDVRPSAVAARAADAGVPVLKPAKARDPEVVAQVDAVKPDVVVVAAYGQVLPKALLEVAPRGAINVHASLLPRWRGASPITAAILSGDPDTGVSIMQMDEGLDTGPVLLEVHTAIGEHEDAETLTARLAEAGALALLKALEMVEQGDARPEPQPEQGVTYAPLVKKRDGDLEWTLRAAEIERALRAYRPWPGIRLPLAGGERVQVLEGGPVPGWWVSEGTEDAAPGTIVEVNAEGIVVMTSSTPFLVKRVKPAGKREMSAGEYARGRRDLAVRR
jgi:methionyl-tRNA formyltransferase